MSAHLLPTPGKSDPYVHPNLNFLVPISRAPSQETHPKPNGPIARRECLSPSRGIETDSHTDQSASMSCTGIPLEQFEGSVAGHGTGVGEGEGEGEGEGLGVGVGELSGQYSD